MTWLLLSLCDFRRSNVEPVDWIFKDQHCEAVSWLQYYGAWILSSVQWTAENFFRFKFVFKKATHLLCIEIIILPVIESRQVVKGAAKDIMKVRRRVEVSTGIQEGQT